MSAAARDGGGAGGGADDQRRRTTRWPGVKKGGRAAAVGCGLLLYLSLFFYLEGESMSYENVVAEEGRLAAAFEATRLQRERAKDEASKEKVAERAAQRLKGSKKNHRHDGAEDDADGSDDGVPFWRILLVYTLLRVWLRSRPHEDDVVPASMGGGGGGGSRNPPAARTRAARRETRLEAEQRHARFDAWAGRLNEERLARGERPLSLDSLRLVLQERERDGGGSSGIGIGGNVNEYDGLLQFGEESGPALQALLRSTGATPDEIDRLPLRVVVVEAVPPETDTTPTVAAAARGTEGGRGGGASSAATTPRHQHNGCCAVCLEPYIAGDVVRTIPCFHNFHQHCIDGWLAQKAECPVCKHSALV